MAQKIKKIVLPIIIFLLSSCAEQAQADREPITHSFKLEKGMKIEIYLDAIEKPYTYTFSLDLLMDKKSPAEKDRIAALWGGNGGYYKDTYIPIPVGLPIPVKLTVDRVTPARMERIFDKKILKESNWEGSDTILAKLIAEIKLEPGRYRIQLESLENVSELNNVPVQFRVLLEHK